MANFKFAKNQLKTTTFLINTASFDDSPTGTIVETSGYSSVGDGGGAQWKKTGSTITASQTPSLTGDVTCSDADGNEFELIYEDVINSLAIGFSTSGDNILAVAAAEASSAVSVDLKGNTYTATTDIDPYSLTKKYFNGTISGLNSNSNSANVKTLVNASDFEVARPRTKSPVVDWTGLEVLWLGTSIPHQGVGTDGYPELFGELLKCNVENYAWSGSAAGYNVAGAEDDIATVKKLSMTEDDRQWGLATYGSSSAYDDSFDVVTNASQMTCDYRIKARFAVSPKDVVFLDHNHNDRDKAAGTLTPESQIISSVTKGATTTITLNSIGTIAIGDAVTVEITGIDYLNYAAARVQNVSGSDITLNIDSSAYTGTFSAGTVYKRDRNTIFGAWGFLISYIKNMSIIYGDGDVKIILSGAPSEHTNDSVFDNGIWSNSELIKQVADFWELSFFDIGFLYDIKKHDHVTYFPDDVHPTTTATRKALAAHWVNWASGGQMPVNLNSYLPSAASTFNNTFSAEYSTFRNGFYTPDKRYALGTAEIDEDFSSGIGSWTASGTTPTDGVSPWDAGEDAILCESTVIQTQSFLSQSSLSVGNDWVVEFDIYLPVVDGLTTETTSRTAQILNLKIGAQAAYLMFLNIRQNTTSITMQYFETPNTTLRTLGGSKTHLQAATKHHIKIDMEKETATTKGYMVVELDGVRVIEGETDDVGQSAITDVRIGLISSNTGDDLDAYFSNVLVTPKTTLDYSTRYTGDVTVTEGTLSFVNGVATALA